METNHEDEETDKQTDWYDLPKEQRMNTDGPNIDLSGQM
jgi:hypothetical protein